MGTTVNEFGQIVDDGSDSQESVFDPTYGGSYPSNTGTYNVASDSYWPTNTASAAGSDVQENVFDPTYGGQYSSVANPVSNIGGGIANYLKSMDLTSAGGLAGALAGATGAFTNKPKKAYQGSIPQLQAVRNMVTAPPAKSTGYRPGQGGVNWNADTYYVPPGSVPAGAGNALAASVAAQNANKAIQNAPVAKKNSTLNTLGKVAAGAGIATLLSNVLGNKTNLTGLIDKTGNLTTTGVKTLLDKITGTKTATNTTSGGLTTAAAQIAAKNAAAQAAAQTAAKNAAAKAAAAKTGVSVNTDNAEQPVYATQEEADAANAAAGDNELSMAGEVSPYNEDGTLKEDYQLDEEGNPVFVSSGDTSTTFTPDGGTDTGVDTSADNGTTFNWDEDMSSGLDLSGTDLSGVDLGDGATYDWENDWTNNTSGIDLNNTDYSGFDFGGDMSGIDFGDFATGGAVNMAKGRYLQGETDGMADKIPAKIGQDQPAALSHGEFVVPADVVSHLGNGNSDAGAKKLYQMMDKIRVARTGTKQQGKKINPDKFMPGGLANAYAAGGSVQGYADGGTTGATGVGAAVNAGITGTETGPNSWAGDYMSNLLGKTQALAESPYQQYMGPLTAGASDLQTKAFTGLQNTAFPSNLGQTFSSTGAYQAPQLNMGAYQTQPIGTGGNTPSAPQMPAAPAQPQGIAAQYMNPYLQSVLDPQLAELRRQNDITNMATNSKLTQAGAFGGGRQAIMNAENNRNLMQEMNKTVGAGYANAYDKAQQQFNTEQTQGRSLADLIAQQGAQQRGIEAEGIAADKAAFEAARKNPYEQLQFQQSMLQGLPISATNYEIAQPTKLQEIMAGAAGGAKAVGTTNKTVADLLAQLGL